MRMLSKIAVPMFVLAAMMCAQNGWAQAAAPAAPSSNTAAGTQLHFAPGTVLPVELDKSIDAKKVHQGDPVVAKVDQDFLSNGKIVIPRKSKVTGHVTEAKASSHDDKSSMVGVVFDKIIVKNGPEVPLNVTVQAIGAPISTSADSGYGGDMGSPSPSNPAGMGGSSPMGGGSPSTNPSGMGGSSSAGMGGNPGGGGYGQMPNGPQGGAMPSGQRTPPLARTAQGVTGLKGLTLRQGPMQDAVIASQEHNVKLDSGTQILLRTK